MRDKASNSADRTNELYEQAQQAQQVIERELEPELRRAQGNVEDVEQKTVITKQAVETISK